MFTEAIYGLRIPRFSDCSTSDLVTELVRVLGLVEHTPVRFAFLFAFARLRVCAFARLRVCAFALAWFITAQTTTQSALVSYVVRVQPCSNQQAPFGGRVHHAG